MPRADSLTTCISCICRLPRNSGSIKLLELKGPEQVCIGVAFMHRLEPRSGPGSSVGIATGYRLDSLGIESRWGARFSAPFQTDPRAHPASCRMGTGSLPGGKERSGRDADPSSLLVPWSRKGRAIPLLPLWAVGSVQSLSACTGVHFTLPCTLKLIDGSVKQTRAETANLAV